MKQVEEERVHRKVRLFPIRADGTLPHRHVQAKEHEHESVQQMEY